MAELRRMKRFATGLLGLFAIIFVISSLYEEQAIWIGFVQATSEAAMVGAIADWFAVTALFRHPLGLKIPHTAIVPRRKDRIGRTLGRFVRENFLKGEVIVGKLHSLDSARQIAAWLRQPEHSEMVANYAAVGVAAAVRVMKDEDVQYVIQHNLSQQVRSVRVAPLLGNLLTMITSGNRKKEVIRGSVSLISHLLEENKEIIKTKINEETPWWLPKNVDNAIYEKVIDASERTLREVRRDPEHPLRLKIDGMVSDFIEDLKHSPEFETKEEAWKEELLEDPMVQEFTASLWFDLKDSILAYGNGSNVELNEPIKQGIIRFAEAILQDEAMLTKINQWIEEGALFVAEEYGHEVEQLIAQTISRWDPEETALKIELQAGKDLQFIRINGTLVGGLVGFLIHAVSLML